MKLDDFNNIDFNNAGSLPAAVKAVLLAFIFLIILAIKMACIAQPVLKLCHALLMTLRHSTNPILT